MALFSKNKKEKKESRKEEGQKNVEQVLPVSPSLPKGENAHSYSVILYPHITEKGALLGQDNKYLFKVAVGADKTEIKKAIESLYKVAVQKINVLYAHSKLRRVGRHEGHKPGFKKAIVTLKEGSKIDIAA
ncbi:MAG: 50S ribosomal protein L23 [Candidatus Yanofskybacteria bacterium]|nr:50S ribosomal protein L23 [Candidatus Yanofskybacteria bacterium]